MVTFVTMETPITPPYLNSGETIGIVAPARSILRDEVKDFVAYLEAFDYRVEFGKHLFGQTNQYSGTTAERLEDLHELIGHPEVKAIFAARGGYGTAQLLPGFDMDLLRKNPTWLCGFSDMTALHSAIGGMIESIHGVMPYSFAMEKPQSPWSFESVINALSGQNLEYHSIDHPLNFKGEVQGRLTGGNLSVLYSLAGTAYEPDYEGKILFLEDLDEYLYHVDRMLLNFELRGVFEKIAGLVIGDHSDIHDNKVPFGKSVSEIIADRAHKYKIPTMFGFPAGHEFSNHALIFGRMATLKVTDGGGMLHM